jgi:hypothetical protein
MAWERFERAVQQPDEEVANRFVKLSTSNFKALARSLDVSNLFLMRVCARAIRAATIPARFVERLASELGATVQAARVARASFSVVSCPKVRGRKKL